MMLDNMTYNIRDFDYELPQELIAQTPIEPRDASRLLVVHRDSGIFEHRHFRDIGDYLRPGDLLIANQSRVLPARLLGHRAETGGAVKFCCWRSVPILVPIIGRRWCVLGADCVRGLVLCLGMRPLMTLR